jgi:large subunit ribosomal protein L4
VIEAATYDANGVAGGSTPLPEDVFDGTVNESALHQVITAILAHQRQGTAATRGRSQVRGGARKPWRQKGTGRARQGTIRAAQWRGGGIVFGPQPRSYDVKVPKKVRRLATRSALNARALDGGLGVIPPLSLEAPSTKAIAGLLDGIEAEGNVLILTDGLKTNVCLSSRNIARVQVRAWGEVSAYDVLWADRVLIESSALASGGDREGADE